jgi:type I restriction enzyme, R subunit
MSERHSEAAFETVIEAHLLANGYVTVSRGCFDRERAIFSETLLAFIRPTQPKEWVNLYARRQDAPLYCSRSVVSRV